MANKQIIEPFSRIIASQQQGIPLGIPSLCSSNSFVIEASFQFAKQNNVPVLIESTSNQVNQFGGYTGKTPTKFAEELFSLADHYQIPHDRIILGGDHLGPNAWKKETASSAMQKAQELMSDCVTAGYSKLHLDASMKCGDDAQDRPLSIQTIANRAALLCQAAEEAYALLSSNAPPPIYVIGTEVPIPGGAQEEEEDLQITHTEDLKQTIETSRNAFYTLGLQDAWERVVAVVVQPGVEFGSSDIHEYDSSRSTALTSFLNNYPQLVFEAHSTDYQTLENLTQMVADRFAILKVGPALTFALRETLFALSMIESEIPSLKPTKLIEKLEEEMRLDPSAWKDHYHAKGEHLAYERKYSLSDRSRYYWNRLEIEQSVETLIRNLETQEIPLPLISQYLPTIYPKLRSNHIENSPLQWIYEKINTVLRDYYQACSLL